MELFWTIRLHGRSRIITRLRRVGARFIWTGVKAMRNSMKNRCSDGFRHAPNAYPVDEKGFYIYPDLATGYNAGLRDLRAKFTGQNSHGLGPASTLVAMLRIFAPQADGNDPDEYAKFVAKWCSVVLDKPLTEISELANFWLPPVPAAAPTVTT